MIRLCLLRIVLILLGPVNIKAIPVDNGVEGDPEVECSASAIVVNINTRNPFEGHVYVKGLYSQDGCRNNEGGGRVAGITLPFEDCNTRRTRSLNPRGVFVSTTVIITFHPKFLTKVDRAYNVQCFYMEADKTVSSDVEVSMLTTGFQTQLVPMPVCRYEILDGGPSGNAVKYVTVGQPVYHKWTCDTETIDTYCMVVHSCFVDDGAGDKVDLLDEQGCAQDRYLLRNLEYLTDLMAGQETHVFKYADRPQLYFQCQVTVAIKEPNQECPRPGCPDPQRGKRSSHSAFAYRPIQDSFGQLDVSTHIDTFDLDENPAGMQQLIVPSAKQPIRSDQALCLSTTGFGLLIAFVLSLLISVIITSVACLKNRHK